MKIFIGSSTKKREIAEEVAKALENVGFSVSPWWEAFHGGDITIERLIQQSDECDGAVFIFGADDKILTSSSRKGEKLLVATRDNVLLEYGIFVGKKGPKRTLFVVEEGVKIPTDLLGVTYIKNEGYLEEIILALDEARSSGQPSEIASRVVIHLSKSLLDKLRTAGPIPGGWYSRALYMGSRGATAWAAVEIDPKYRGGQNANVIALIEQLAIKTGARNSRCIISFGPGGGELDGKVLPILSGHGPVDYITVDINYYLAVEAADSLDRASASTRAPFCIVADFEDDMRVITHILNEHTPPGRVFTMLGGTFGNLEKGENKFLEGLHKCMKKEDLAILDVFTWKKGYEVEKDPYSDIASHPKTVSRWLAGGVARRFRIREDNIVESITDYIKFESGQFKTDVPGTKAFALCCAQGTYDPLVYVRRYDFEAFGKHLQNRGFDVIAADTVGEPNELVHRAVYFLKKR